MFIYVVALSTLLFIQIGDVRQGRREQVDNVPTLSVCEALSHLLQYDGKLVRIRGRVHATEESAAFVGDDCPGIIVTDGHVWPSAISWQTPG